MVRKRKLIKLRYSNETFPNTEAEWNMMASNCGKNSTYANTSDHRWIVVAPRSDNTHHQQQRRVSTSASSSASSHCTAEDDLLDEVDDFDVHCSSRVEEEGSYTPSTLRRGILLEEAAGRSKHRNIYLVYVIIFIIKILYYRRRRSCLRWIIVPSADHQ